MSSLPLLRWAEHLRPVWDASGVGPAVPLNRKIWEWCYILQVLEERGMLRPGAVGLGFGVGRDPIAAVLASFGCRVVATDLDARRASERGWVKTRQFSGTVEALNEHKLCDPEKFNSLVSFRTVDMNHIPADLEGFDFSWSACSLEHLGSIALGQEFVLRQMHCLRPAAVAVHTTEYNVFSDGPTITTGETVIFRRADIQWLVEELHAEGDSISVDFDAGDSQVDRYVDVPPWSGPHLKLQLGAFVSTSIALVVQRSADVEGAHMLTSRRRRIRRRLARHSYGAVRLFDRLNHYRSKWRQ